MSCVEITVYEVIVLCYFHDTATVILVMFANITLGFTYFDLIIRVYISVIFSRLNVMMFLKYYFPTYILVLHKTKSLRYDFFVKNIFRSSLFEIGFKKICKDDEQKWWQQQQRWYEWRYCSGVENGPIGYDNEKEVTQKINDFFQ